MLSNGSVSPLVCASIFFLLIFISNFTIYTQVSFGDDTPENISATRQAAQNFVKAGQQLLKQSHYNEAVKEFKEAISIDKTYIPAYEWLSQAYFSQGMQEEALRVFQRAAALSPNNGSIHFNLGVLLSRKGRYEDAVKEYMKAIKLGVKHSGVYHNLGIIYSKQGKHEEAISVYRKAIQSDNSAAYPYSAQLRYDLALEYSEIGDIGSATKLAESAKDYIGNSQSLPSIINFHYGLGMLLFQLGKKEDALVEYEKAAALIEAKFNDTSPIASHVVPTIFEQGKRKSIVSLDRLKIWESIAGLCFALRKFDKAEKAFHKAIKYASDRTSKASYHVGLSAVYMDQYKFDAMEKELKKAIQLDSSSPEAYYMMGRLFSLRNELEKARRSFRMALAIDPNSADAHFLLGTVFQEQGKSAKAIREFRKAIKINPKLSMYHYRLANELIKQGHRKEGMKHLKEYKLLIQQESEEKREQLGRIEARPAHEEGSVNRESSGHGSPLTAKPPRNGVSADRKVTGLKFITTPSRTRPDEDAVPITSPLSPSNLSLMRRTARLPMRESKIPTVKQERETVRGGTYPQFIDITLEAGLNFKHYHGAKGPATILETTGAGVAFCDYDKDGYLDVYAVNGCDVDASSAGDLQHRNALYRNLGNGTFLDVTSEASVGDSGYGMGCVFGDYDNDGDDDLYVSNYGKNVLYRNNGDGTFTDVTDAAGVGDARFGASCAFADYDCDGDLDLYVTNYVLFGPGTVKYCIDQGVVTGCGPMHYEAQSDILYRNNGDGTFTDVSKEAGIAEYKGKGLGVMFADYDNDGDLDIYVANDTTPNLLFRNDGNGKFTEVGLFAGVAFKEDGEVDSGMGVDFGDYNRDGYLDLFVTDFQTRPNTLYLNNKNGLFTPAAFKAHLAEPSLKYLGFGTNFLDYNNDGYLDIFIANGHVYDNVETFDETATYRQRNQLFRNERDGTFAEVTKVSGSGMLVEKASRGAALGDYDNDGDTDVVVSNSNDTLTLLRNDGGNMSNFLNIELIGVVSNRNGVGSRIKILCGKSLPAMESLSTSEHSKSSATSSTMQIAEVRSGAGFLSHSDFRVAFGLGNHTYVESVEIKWPSGIVDKFENIPANNFIRVLEGMKSRITRIDK